MTTRPAARLLVPASTLAAALALGAALAIGSSAASGPTGHAAAKRITAAGVDGVKLGMTHARLRQLGLVKRIRKGCELAGPNTRSAGLRAPLTGHVNYTLTTPRRVADISIRGGATARGVGIGAKIRVIKAAFPKAIVDHSTDQVFQLTLVRIPRNGGGRITFGVSTVTKRTIVIGVPRIAFCE